jgi:serine/threonine protein kinase
LYELLCGQPPFHGESVLDTYDEIIGGVLEFSRNIEPSAKDLIGDCLQETLNSA